MVLDNLSIHMMNVYGEIRSPFLIPVVGLEGVVFFLLIRMEIEVVVTQDMISLTRLGGKPK